MVPLPLFIEAHTIIHIVAQPIIQLTVQPHLDNPHHAYHADEFPCEEDERDEIKGMKERFQVLEKTLRAMEGDQVFGVVAKEMCLVFGLVIPTKFKNHFLTSTMCPSCPKSHLIIYYRNMTVYVENDKLMIHYFQDSLSGASSKWYLSLDQSRIQCFQDLYDAFIKHYK